MGDLSAQQQQAMKNLLSRTKSDQATTLDPSDEGTRAAIHMFLEMGNRTANRYPALHAALARAEAPPPCNDVPTVVDLGPDSAGRATSRTWIACAGMPYLSGATTLVIDTDSGALLASGTAAAVGDGLLRVGTNTSTAAQASGKLTAMTVYHAQATPDAPVRFGAVSRSAVSLGAGPGIAVSDPVIKIAGHTFIKIGLNRQGPQPDCDYSFLESAPQADPPLLVPFTGSASLPYNITGVQPNGQITGLTASSQIYIGLSPSSIDYPAQPWSYKSAILGSTTAPNLLYWSFPYPGGPIVYGAATNALDMKSAFYFQFNVPVSAPNPTYSFAVCSVDTPGQPSVYCYQIPDVDFTWHCLADDTMVMRDDGAMVSIRELHNRMRLRTGVAEGSLAVEATWRGKHSAEGGNAVRLTASTGNRLVATASHPIMTPRGPRAAGDLAVGDQVMVAGGFAVPLREVESIAYDGIMWNVELGNADDRARGFLAAATPGTFVANGFVVGDFNAQKRWYRASRLDYDYMAGRLPESHQRDYLSAIEDSVR
jgi:hypothetical protein